MPMKAFGRLPAATDPVRDELTRARTALAQSSIYVLRKLHIDQDGESLIMRGRVDSYYHKQLAQELVKAAVMGVEVINALQVVYTPKSDYFVESH